MGCYCRIWHGCNIRKAIMSFPNEYFKLNSLDSRDPANSKTYYSIIAAANNEVTCVVAYTASNKHPM